MPNVKLKSGLNRENKPIVVLCLPDDEDENTTYEVRFSAKYALRLGENIIALAKGCIHAAETLSPEEIQIYKNMRERLKG